MIVIKFAIETGPNLTYKLIFQAKAYHFSTVLEVSETVLVKDLFEEKVNDLGRVSSISKVTFVHI